MSDEKEAAWYEYKRTHSGLFPDAGLDFAYGYDAGRVSRDAEVREAVRVANENAAEGLQAVARAGAAEATLLRVHRLLGSEELGLRTYGISAEDLREALSTPAVSHPEPTEGANRD